jgi:hypothetical protein
MSTELQVVPDRRRRAAQPASGKADRTGNSHGKQVVDTWCFNTDDLPGLLSMDDLNRTIQGAFPATGDALTTNRLRPILIVRENWRLPDASEENDLPAFKRGADQV